MSVCETCPMKMNGQCAEAFDGFGVKVEQSYPVLAIGVVNGDPVREEVVVADLQLAGMELTENLFSLGCEQSEQEFRDKLYGTILQSRNKIDEGFEARFGQDIYDAICGFCVSNGWDLDNLDDSMLMELELMLIEMFEAMKEVHD